ncbi:pilus assembly protein TadG-related protein [Micromonospora zamorensis]|uniref:pilus assembly protein TadG-related protein n=1 Tax=Micromonospora zamorensis TaxID=709883 RepID=UPI0033CD148B
MSRPWLETVRRQLREDRGSGIGWAAGMFLVGMLAAALIIDGGAAMTMRVDARHVAQQAARAGADRIDLLLLRTAGTVQLDPVLAEAAATEYLAQVRATGTVSATTTLVTVTVTKIGPTPLLAAIGITTVTVSTTERAEPVTS